MTRYPCLVLDHDDTTVRSTDTIHYLSFLDTMSKLRPGLNIPRSVYQRQWYEMTFDEFCRGQLHMTDAEMKFQ